MHLNPASTSLALSFALTTLANPLQKSPTLVARVAEPSDYPYGQAATNEFKWINWDPDSDTDKADGMKIHQAFLEWADFVQSGAKAAADTDSATYKRWFGKQDPPEETKKVFDNMWDGSNANKIIAGMTCDRKDFSNKCTAKMAAYTDADSGNFHVCPYGLNERKQLSEIQCSDLDDSCSSKMRSLSMTLLHEMTHYEKVGAAARGTIGIVDFAKGAYDCFKLDDEDKGDNAQNYAWLAGEAFFSTECSRTFNDPAPGVQNIDDDEDAGDPGPSSSTPSPVPVTLANPTCDHSITYDLRDTMSLQSQLTQAGNSNNCCTAPRGDCGVLLPPVGGAALYLCGPTGHSKQCTGCADLGKAMNVLNVDCQQNARVGGKVSIPYLDGVTLELQAAVIT